MTTRHTSSMFGASAQFDTQPQRITSKLLATQGYVVGIEISGGGTRQSVALADLDGKIVHRVHRPLESIPDTETLLRLLDNMLADVMSPERLEGNRVLRVGVAVGGLVDVSQGVVRTLHHAHGWDNFPLQKYLEERLDIPCIIDNNANAAALAETCYGAGIGERVVLYVGLGRGIGGGLIVNNKIYHGVTCTAGEIGHMLVNEQGPRCSCGGSGHLEAIASAQAITSTMIELSTGNHETQAALGRITDGQARHVTAAQIFQLAANGDKIAQHVVEDVETSLGMAFANIVHLVNPGMLILGGPVAQAGDLLLAPLRTRIQQLCLPAASQNLQIVQGKLGPEANIVGAVTLALQDI